MYIAVALVILLVDQILKYIVRLNFNLGETIPVIEDVFHLTYVQNTGAAFGILAEHRLFFIVFSVLVIVAMPVFLRRLLDIKGRNRLFSLCLGLILGGAAGNLIDRIVFGYVIDYLDFRIWPVFNLADSAIVVGSLLLFFVVWKAGDIDEGEQEI